ncbi:MAG: hypothetical protein Aurels2KO_49280 [Aureliella sp.]
MVISLLTYEPGPDEDPEPHLIEHHVRDFDELLQYFDDIYDSYSSFHQNSTGNGVLGGFEIELRTPGGRSLHVGIGTERWLLYEDLQSSGFITDGGTSNRELIFYLEALHWTSFPDSELINRDDCLRYIESWINDGD